MSNPISGSPEEHPPSKKLPDTMDTTVDESPQVTNRKHFYRVLDGMKGTPSPSEAPPAQEQMGELIAAWVLWRRSIGGPTDKFFEWLADVNRKLK